jgi:hypothetical protein
VEGEEKGKGERAEEEALLGSLEPGLIRRKRVKALETVPPPSVPREQNQPASAFPAGAISISGIGESPVVRTQFHRLPLSGKPARRGIWGGY